MMNLESKITQYLKDGNIREAEKLIQEEEIKGKGNYYYFMGLCNCSKGDYKQGIRFFNLAVNEGIQNYILLYNLGVAHLKLKNYNLALHYFKESTKKNELYENNYYNIAYIQYTMGFKGDAYRTIKEGIIKTSSENLANIEKELFKRLI